jgi:hypothetical protein
MAPDRDLLGAGLYDLGGVAAIGQQNIKRLLAYSSINNVGFALIGLAAATRDGVASVLFYMAVYVVMTIGSFLCVLRMRDENGRPVETIASLSGLSRTRPGLAVALAMFMFSLAGIPPLFGFWPKFLVFDAAVRADLTWLAAVGIATSVIGAYYYLKIIKTMYFDDPRPPYERSRDRVEGVLIALAALFVSPLGYFSIPYLGAAANNAGPGPCSDPDGRQTGSTTDDLAAARARGCARRLLAARGAAEPLAEDARGGAGTRPVGNLLRQHVGSARPADPPAPSLAMEAAVALHEVVSAFAPSIKALIKWPNDLLVDVRKLSGILIERADDAVVIGIGVNLGHHPDGLDRPSPASPAYGSAPTPPSSLRPSPKLRPLARAAGAGRACSDPRPLASPPIRSAPRSPHGQGRACSTASRRVVTASLGGCRPCHSRRRRFSSEGPNAARHRRRKHNSSSPCEDG